MTAKDARAIVITGPVGAGKTTTADALTELLIHANIPVVMYDMDMFRHVYPLPRNDHFAMALGFRSLAACWREMRTDTYDAPGRPAIAVLADVVEHRDQKRKYEIAMPDANVEIVRLNVDIERVVQRLEHREPEYRIQWYRERAAELQGIMERERVGDLVIDVGDDTPGHVASRIADALALVPAS